MKNSYFLFGIGSALLLLFSCSNQDEPLQQSVIDPDDPITRVLTNYISETQQTRQNLDDLIITNVERHIYSISKEGISEETQTRGDSHTFEVDRADFSLNGKSGYAYLTTNSLAEGVYYYTDNGTINDTVQNKDLGIMLSAIPETVGLAIGDSIIVGPVVPPSPPIMAGTGVLLKTHWGQYYPYNLLAPKFYTEGVSQLAPAGCSAIAAAQIIAYCGRFTGTFYGCNNISFPDLVTYDFENGYYIGDDIKMTIASFIHEVGLNINMKYGVDGSGASIKSIRNYLCEMGYTCYRTSGLDLDDIEKHLMGTATSSNKKCPVIVCGYNSTITKGHAWIIDGVNPFMTNREFHINWGWGGSSNGWAIDELVTVANSNDPQSDYYRNTQTLYINDY